MKNRIFTVISVALNVLLITYVFLKADRLADFYSNSTLEVQNNLVQLESALDYQMKNKWEDENHVVEKIEDVRESIHNLMVTGKDLGVISKNQEDDLWNLYWYFTNYPTYTGFPDQKVTDKEVNELIDLRDHLRSAGWGANISYSSDWESFSEKIGTLLKN
ncbi:hypothetical protein [Gorillibacterium timonense]|uniref:hypothetical protein n=1 Tax=Gorillibacterium timonense TaxID=1689269 RepID=UPI00071D6C31|nr:hypothetical protein [Gorillibacterium timonense]